MPREMKSLNLDLLLTRACPMDCVYCGLEHRAGTMSSATWKRAVDLLLREDGPLELQLMGGEPLLEYGLVREIFAYASGQAVKKEKSLRLGVTTNGLLLTPERSRELGELGCTVMLSFDGDRETQIGQRVVRSGGDRTWDIQRRNLKGLVSSGTPFFVNLVATPAFAGRLSRNVAFLLAEGVRAFQISYALGVAWGEEPLRDLEREIAAAARLADAASPRAEIFNRRNEAEPVLLSPQHVVDTDGRLYVGTSIVLESLWPELHAAFLIGALAKLKRLPGRGASPAGQLRRLRGAPLPAAARRVALNNLAVGKRMKQLWRAEEKPSAPKAAMPIVVLTGEPTDRRALSNRLGELGVRAEDPYRSGTIGEAYLMLTMACNLRCRACSLWGMGGACHSSRFHEAKSRPVPLKRMLALIDELVPYRPQNVNFSGGEPLLSPHWAALAAHAKKRGLRTILTTNGVYLERHAEKVSALFDQVSISVACPPSMREELRMGPPGHYEAMVRGLKKMAALRDRHPGRKPLLRMLCEVFDSNAEHLGETVEHLKNEGVVFDEILFQHLIFNRPEVLAAQEKAFREEFDLPLNLWRGYAYRPQPIDYEAFDRALAGLRERYPQARFSVDLRGAAALRDYYEGRREEAGSAFCDGPWTQANIFPNGDVWVCPDYALGNITQGAFAEIWDGEKARALRRRVCRKLFPACRGCFSFFNTQLPHGLSTVSGGR
ncbi:MAG: radical SAM protein [Elusimicrobia bacterium]|nr:radical SAM protein [Elusimicrobiota bacterium]